MKLSGFHGDLTIDSTNAGSLNTVAVTGMKIDSGMFAGQTQLENWRKNLLNILTKSIAFWIF